MSEWMKHDGNSLPCDSESFVFIMQRDGFEDYAQAKNFGWKHRTDSSGNPWLGDIVKYKMDDNK